MIANNFWQFLSTEELYPLWMFLLRENNPQWVASIIVVLYAVSKYFLILNDYI